MELSIKFECEIDPQKAFCLSPKHSFVVFASIVWWNASKLGEEIPIY